MRGLSTQKREKTQMPIVYEELMAMKTIGQQYAWTDREIMLYAYGIGLGADPMNETELAFVNEGTYTPRPLKVVPTFASVAAWGSGPGDMKLNRVMVVDGERDITFHKPIPVEAKITADSSVLGVFDKGADKGAVILHQTILRDEKGDALATLVASRFARGDGGFGGPSEGQPEAHKVPSRAPDKTIDITTRPDQALIFLAEGVRPDARPDPVGADHQVEDLSRRRSCMACAPMASPAAAYCRLLPITIPPRSSSTARGSRRRCFRARPSPWICGRTATW
jgi:hypothetical protein